MIDGVRYNLSKLEICHVLPQSVYILKHDVIPELWTTTLPSRLQVHTYLHPWRLPSMFLPTIAITDCGNIGVTSRAAQKSCGRVTEDLVEDGWLKAVQGTSSSQRLCVTVELTATPSFFCCACFGIDSIVEGIWFQIHLDGISENTAPGCHQMWLTIDARLPCLRNVSLVCSQNKQPRPAC